MPFFWFWSPPRPDLPLIDWLPFRSEMWAWLALVSVVALLLMVLLYRWRIQRFRIRYPTDPFRVPSTAWWLGWLLWAAVPAIALGIIYWRVFRARFAITVVPTWGSITAGLVSWVITLAIFQVLLWIPGITPRKFLYHPRWPWRLHNPARRPVVVPPGS